MRICLQSLERFITLVAQNQQSTYEERQMTQYADKGKEPERRNVVQQGQRKSSQDTVHIGDNRPVSVAQRRMIELANSSKRGNKIAQLFGKPVQKKGPEDEDELQFKSKEAVQKKGPEDEDELQFKAKDAVQLKGPEDEDELQFKAAEPVQKKENKTGLPDDLKAGVENLSGMAMDDVRVHYNSGKPAQLNAYAYTQGTEIHVAPGQEKHLPHEAWHVVQQKQGRVQPTMQMAGGVAVNDDEGLEREADGMGGKAQSQPSQPRSEYFTHQVGVVLQRTKDRWIRGRYVTGAEQDKDELMSDYYSTWAYVDDIRKEEVYAYRQKIPTIAWMNAWDPYERAVDAAITKWINSNRTDFSEFVKGSPLWTLRMAVVAAGGFISHGGQRPGTIPVIDDPNELIIDNAINCAYGAYQAWNDSLATRGPFHPVKFTRRQRYMLGHRPTSCLRQGWHVAYSDTTGRSLHHAGRPSSEIDPKTGYPATFIYHIQTA
jgi:hypothetical protein